MIAEVWRRSRVECIERFQVKFCKFGIKIENHVAFVTVLGECGRYGLFVQNHKRCIKYSNWLKLLTMSANRYPKQCYFFMKPLDQVNRVTWATHVKNVLFTCGFGHVWISQEVGDDVLSLNMLGQRLRDCNQQEWHDNICESNKLSMYKGYKSVLTVQFYLSITHSVKYRRIVCLLTFAN